MLKPNELCDILWEEISRYKRPLEGIELSAQWRNSECTLFRLVLEYKYRNGGGLIPYAEDVPHFWYNMSPEFIRNNFQVMIRNLIKSSLGVEIERLFGWETGFNPL